MLKLRIVTALVLAPAVVAAVFLLPAAPFALFVGLLALPGLYEWAALSGLRSLAARAAYTLGGAGGLGLLWLVPVAWPVVLWVVALFWAVATIFVLSFPAARSAASRGPAMAVAGAPVFAGAWLGLVVLKGQDAGHWLIVWMFVLVWAADIGAYFAGRAVGRRRLAPRVSPGKTWEGALGGTALAVALASLLAWALGWASWPAWVALAAGLAVVAILGDLFESAIKRARDVKDSGGLLPGHGGVLDRIDSTVAVAPIFALCASSLGWSSLV